MVHCHRHSVEACPPVRARAKQIPWGISCGYSTGSLMCVQASVSGDACGLCVAAVMQAGAWPSAVTGRCISLSLRRLSRCHISSVSAVSRLSRAARLSCAYAPDTGRSRCMPRRCGCRRPEAPHR